MGSGPQEARTTLVSAPGKVLIAGGYLVLDPAYPGLVISTDSRFYSYATSRRQEEKVDERGRGHHSKITVRSPQFVQAEWEYVVKPHLLEGLGDGEDGEHDGRRIEWSLEQTASSMETSGPNPFVSLALLYTIRLANELEGADHVRSVLEAHGGGLDIYVLGDNDFYSQRDTLSLTPPQAPSSEDLRSLPPFVKQTCKIKDVHKTGLGSSAAMTTSLVGCLLIHLGAAQDPLLRSESSSVTRTEDLTESTLALIHNLAQLAHCAAQGKVGSGFDVSAAVWGSQLYRRFEPAVIQSILDEGEKVTVEGETKEEEMLDRMKKRQELLPILDPHNPLWFPSPLDSASKSTHPTAIEGLVASLASEDVETAGGSVTAAKVHVPAPLQLPPGLEMVLADVDAGSNTPSLVGKVMEWRKNKKEWAAQLYSVLATSNQSLADDLLGLSLNHEEDPKAYNEALRMASKVPCKQWDDLAKQNPSDQTINGLRGLRNTLRSIRAGMRELGLRSGAPVEPDSMGNLIRYVCENVAGVVGGGVPGAGGYDALYIIYLKPPKQTDEVGEAIEKVWKERWNPTEKEEEQLGPGSFQDDGLSVGPLLSRAGHGRNKRLVDPRLVREDQVGKDPSLSVEDENDLLTGQASSPSKAGLQIENLQEVKGLKQAIGL
ncbi:ribosomal protein S5 domain 2-like protein [Violaceomyces palustris]|uniref:Ribosomal protein S5 domain 2-like protein n=1 Tax=Violaceomyces palustris TaxID=1673888 RepID=A0ACD0NTU4_9BASI|nr:ribosomal protein S5 domain 2-like protein [Violaceomyces palustris]